MIERVRMVIPLALCALVMLAADGEGQRRRGRLTVRPVPEVGARGGYDVKLKVAMVGAQVRVPVAALSDLMVSGDYYFTSDVAAWQVNADFAFRLGPLQLLYGGGGVALSRRFFERSDFRITTRETRLGLNLLAGVTIPRFRRYLLRPYAEARWTWPRDRDVEINLVAGLNLALGGW
jgi:hypothetical protein